MHANKEEDAGGEQEKNELRVLGFRCAGLGWGADKKMRNEQFSSVGKIWREECTFIRSLDFHRVMLQRGFRRIGLGQRLSLAPWFCVFLHDEFLEHNLQGAHCKRFVFVCCNELVSQTVNVGKSGENKVPHTAELAHNLVVCVRQAVQRRWYLSHAS